MSSRKILRLARSGRNDGPPAQSLGDVDRLTAFGNGPRLVGFDKNCITLAGARGGFDPFGVCNQEIVADYLYAIAYGTGEGAHTIWIVFAHWVFY